MGVCVCGGGVGVGVWVCVGKSEIINSICFVFMIIDNQVCGISIFMFLDLLPIIPHIQPLVKNHFKLCMIEHSLHVLHILLIKLKLLTNLLMILI